MENPAVAETVHSDDNISLGEIASVERGAEPDKHHRVSPLLIWAAVLLCFAVAYHYTFEIQPLARVAIFKRAVKESKGDWRSLETQLAKLGFMVQVSSKHTDSKVVDLCPFQTNVKRLLRDIRTPIPVLRQLEHFVCTQVAEVHLDTSSSSITRVNYMVID